LVDFGEVAERPFAPIVRREGLVDREDVRVVPLRRVFLWSGGEDGLSSFCYLSEYPACPKAMSWDCVWSSMDRAGFVQ